MSWRAHAIGLIGTRNDEELAELMGNLGGHDLPSLIGAFEAARRHDRPVCFIAYSNENTVGDFTVVLPAVDVSAIGAGGGSIAWLDAEGVLKVGPRSAGAKPGPACYGRGGTEPTVTDAYAVLGIMTSILGGEMQLHLDKPRTTGTRTSVMWRRLRSW